MSCSCEGQPIVHCAPVGCACVDGVTTLVSGAGGAGDPQNLIPCTPPANPFTGYDPANPPQYTAQLPWTPSTPPASLLPAPSAYAQGLYQQYFGLSAIPSSAG